MSVPDASALTVPAGTHATVVDIDEDGEDRLALPPNYPFFLVHYATDRGAWFVGEIEEGPDVPQEDVGTWWLPKLTPDHQKPGLCLHRTLQDGEDKRSASHNAHTAIQRDGGIVLPRKQLGYCVGYPCKDPITKRVGTYYTDPWSTPRPPVRNRQQKFAFDHQRYRRWLLMLVREGYVEPPSEDIIAELRRRHNARIARREAQYDLPEQKRERLVADAKEVASKIETAKVAEFEAPNRRPGRRKKLPAPKVESD